MTASLAHAAAGRPPRWVFPLALGVALAVFGPHLRNGFVWDDHAFLEGNPAITGADPWSATLGRDLWYAIGDSGGTPPFRYYRPAFAAVMRLLWTAGGGSPVAFHLASLALHLVNALLVLALLPRLGATRGIAFAVSALFLIHPLSGEAVYWAETICEQTVLAALLAALLAAVQAREGDPRRRTWFGALAALASAVAVFTKETGVVVPLLVTAEALRASRLEWAARLRAAWPAWLSLPAYLAARAAALGAAERTGLEPGDLLRRAGRVGEILAWDLRRLAFPLPLSPMHALPEPGTASIAIGIAVVLAAGAALLVIARFRPRELFWASWLLLPVLPPVAQVFVSRATPFAVAERYLFLSLVPALVLQARAASALARRFLPQPSAALAAATAAAFMGCAVPTALYGRAFADDDAYFGRTLAVYPDDPVALLHFGRRALERRDAAAALPLLDASVRRARRPISYLYLGIALRALERPHEALAAYGNALVLDGGLVQARLARADLLRELGRIDDAGEEYERAVELSPRNPDARLALGTYRYMRGDVAAAVEQWRAGVSANPGSCELLFNLGLGYAALRQPDPARAQLARFLAECTTGFEAQRARATALLAR